MYARAMTGDWWLVTLHSKAFPTGKVEVSLVIIACRVAHILESVIEAIFLHRLSAEHVITKQGPQHQFPHPSSSHLLINLQPFNTWWKRGLSNDYDLQLLCDLLEKVCFTSCRLFAHTRTHSLCLLRHAYSLYSLRKGLSASPPYIFVYSHPTPRHWRYLL